MARVPTHAARTIVSCNLTEVRSPVCGRRCDLHSATWLYVCRLYNMYNERKRMISCLLYAVKLFQSDKYASDVAND
jgi:hypothetical protein